MVNYPVSTLPLSGLRETPADYGDLEHEFQVPYSQSAPTRTKGARKFSLTHNLLNASEVATFRAFWANYAAAGSFQFVHPRTGSTLPCLMKSTPSIVQNEVDGWDVSCNFEEALL